MVDIGDGNSSAFGGGLIQVIGEFKMSHYRSYGVRSYRKRGKIKYNIEAGFFPGQFSREVPEVKNAIFFENLFVPLYLQIQKVKFKCTVHKGDKNEKNIHCINGYYTSFNRM